MLGACTAQAISDFDSECYQNGDCTDWATTYPACEACVNVNPPADGGNGPQTGAVVYDGSGYEWLNAAGCVAIEDKSDGGGCAPNLQELGFCQDYACGDVCETDADYENCITAVNAGACSTYYTAASSTCAADMADGGSLNTTCSTDIDIVNAICGTGMN
jgi:hypothetical protein